MIQFLVRFLRHPVKNWLILRHPIAFLIQWVRVTNKPLAKVCVLNYEKSVKNRIWKNRICSACQKYLYILFFCEKVCSVKKNRQIMVSNTRLDSLHMTHSLPLQGRISERLSFEKSSSFSQILHISPIWDKITEVKNPYVLCKIKDYINISVRLWNFKEDGS